MKNTRNIQINLFSSESAINNDIKHCENINEVIKTLKKNFAEGSQDNLSFNSNLDSDLLKQALESDFNMTARNGIIGGCYGARNGKTHRGLTLFVSPCEFPDRWIDSEGDEIVNLYHSIIDNCDSELDCDEETFDRYLEVFNIKEVQHYNTYNDCGEVYRLFDVEFKVYETEDGSCILAAEFHCGGDIRGNYASARYFRFDIVEDIYTAVYPCAYLKEA